MRSPALAPRMGPERETLLRPDRGRAPLESRGPSRREWARAHLWTMPTTPPGPALVDDRGVQRDLRCGSVSRSRRPPEPLDRRRPLTMMPAAVGKRPRCTRPVRSLLRRPLRRRLPSVSPSQRRGSDLMGRWMYPFPRTPGRTPEHRFGEKCWYDLESDCVLWMGCRGRGGYGVIWWDGKLARAPRVAVWLSGREIPDGMFVDHICENPPCVNPEHLRVVTPAFNALRGASEAAKNARKILCKRGHPLDGANLDLRRNGARQCIACRLLRPGRDRARERRKRARAAWKAAGLCQMCGKAPAVAGITLCTRCRDAGRERIRAWQASRNEGGTA